jgi:hypothetical protein
LLIGGGDGELGRMTMSFALRSAVSLTATAVTMTMTTSSPPSAYDDGSGRREGGDNGDDDHGRRRGEAGGAPMCGWRACPKGQSLATYVACTKNVQVSCSVTCRQVTCRQVTTRIHRSFFCNTNLSSTKSTNSFLRTCNSIELYIYCATRKLVENL